MTDTFWIVLSFAISGIITITVHLKRQRKKFFDYCAVDIGSSTDVWDFLDLCRCALVRKRELLSHDARRFVRELLHKGYAAPNDSFIAIAEGDFVMYMAQEKDFLRYVKRMRALVRRNKHTDAARHIRALADQYIGDARDVEWAERYLARMRYPW